MGVDLGQFGEPSEYRVDVSDLFKKLREGRPSQHLGSSTTFEDGRLTSVDSVFSRRITNDSNTAVNSSSVISSLTRGPRKDEWCNRSACEMALMAIEEKPVAAASSAVWS